MADPDTPRWIEYHDLDEVQGAPRNPKNHDLDTLGASFDRLGYIDAVNYDERTGRLVGGHGRLEKLRERRDAGEAPPEGIVVRDGRWLLPVERGWASADDDEAEAALVALNSGDRAGWKRDELAEMLTDLAAGPGLAGTGYDDADLSSLLADLERERMNEPTPREGDGEPEGAPPEPIIGLGEEWRLGDHVLICGDALDFADRILELAPTAVYADPPYGMDLQTDYKKMHRRERTRWGESNTFPPVAGDDADFDAAPMLEVLDGIAEQFWWGADYYRASIPAGGSWIVWDKRSHDGEAKFDDVIGNQFELCWSRTQHRREIARITWSGLHGVHGPGEVHRRLHPTQKPVALAEWFFDRWVAPDAVVLDPYAGSGPTLVACQRTGRRSVSVELSPDYCDVIAWRWQGLTGDKPIGPDGEPRDFSR